MSAAHTPGPWRVEDHTGAGGGYVQIMGPDHLRIADLFPFARPAEPRDVIEANARLIAAAPDLLALASKPAVYQVEESEGVIRLSIGGVEICAHPDGTPEATVLLLFGAEQRAAIRKAGGR